MAPHLRVPFDSLSADNFLSRGAAGHVFQISSNIVFKCPTQFDDPLPQQIEEMEDSAKRIEAEKAVYHVLMQRRHPNIVQCILCAPEGIFLRRMESTLQERLSSPEAAKPRPDVQERWVRQLTSAVAWLEGLGLVHGDLRPANILLDENDDIRLADFDASVKPGAELLVASEPFSKMNENFETPLAGPESEQFSLASCIYTIRFGHWPFHDLEPEVRFQRLIRNEFPPVSSDHPFGEVTRRCWLGEYGSVAAVERDVLSRLGRTDTGAEARRLEALNKEDAARHLVLRAECEELIAREVRTLTWRP